MIGRDVEHPKPVRNWLTGEHRGADHERRLGAIEDMISYWVPISSERDLRIDAIEQRLARIEAALIPEQYSCVAHLVDQVKELEATVWEIRRRLDLGG
jgi:hypothetical protein